METQIEQFFSSPEGVALIVLLTIWDLFWRGRGMWISAQKKQPIWFVAILLLNTVGIVPLVYIYGFSKRHKDESESVESVELVSDTEDSDVA